MSQIIIPRKKFEISTKIAISNPHTKQKLYLKGVIDTGAEITTIPESIAKTLRLNLVSKENLTYADGSEKSVFVYLVVLHFSSEFEFLWKCPGVPGKTNEILIGMDFLRDKPYTYQPHTSELIITL